MKYAVLVKIMTERENAPYWTGWEQSEEITPEAAAEKARKMYGDYLEKLLDVRVREIPDYLDIEVCELCRIQDNEEDREKMVYTPMYTDSDSRSDTLIWRIIALVSLSGLLISQILRLLSELL